MKVDTEKRIQTTKPAIKPGIDKICKTNDGSILYFSVLKADDSLQNDIYVSRTLVFFFCYFLNEQIQKYFQTLSQFLTALNGRYSVVRISLGCHMS